MLRRITIWTLLGLAGLVVAGGLFTVLVNVLVIRAARPFLLSSPAAATSAPVAIVPGASVKPDGTPTPMMRDRMDTAILLYQQGKVKALDLSGFPNEVNFMTSYARAAGVPPSALLADPAGSDTYDTMANARNRFHVQQALICTQRFHLSRAVYLARSLGINATGVPTDIQPYPHDLLGTTLREWGARVKAFLQVNF
jgi:SanA protein